MRLDFVTDGSVQTRGFQMNYIVEGKTQQIANFLKEITSIEPSKTLL